MATETEHFVVYAHVKEKIISVVCGRAGDAPQKVKWLANVAIARYDDERYEGWQLLGRSGAASRPRGRRLTHRWWRRPQGRRPRCSRARTTRAKCWI